MKSQRKLRIGDMALTPRFQPCAIHLPCLAGGTSALRDCMAFLYSTTSILLSVTIVITGFATFGHLPTKVDLDETSRVKPSLTLPARVMHCYSVGRPSSEAWILVCWCPSRRPDSERWEHPLCASFYAFMFQKLLSGLLSIPGSLETVSSSSMESHLRFSFNNYVGLCDLHMFLSTFISWLDLPLECVFPLALFYFCKPPLMLEK